VGDDVVTLVLPREPEFHPVARLVLAGLSARLQLTYENLEDLQLGLGGLLEHSDGDGGELIVRVAIGADTIETEVGPFVGGGLQAELERDDHGGVGLRRLLEAVVDSVELEEKPTGTVVRLVKHVDLAQTQR
jgi:anti-sigma regulatory factor (Ser/Thr protein kinase)